MEGREEENMEGKRGREVWEGRGEGNYGKEGRVGERRRKVWKEERVWKGGGERR